jgi:hypothetical protein
VLGYQNQKRCYRRIVVPVLLFVESRINQAQSLPEKMFAPLLAAALLRMLHYWAQMPNFQQ